MAKSNNFYNEGDYGPAEAKLRNLFFLQRDDAREYFINTIKPRLDRSYKLYIAYGGDRQREIKKWQSNVQIPYVQSAVETMVPRIIDARPEFSVMGRKQENQEKAEKQQKLGEFLWENAKMDATNEDFVRSALIYGISYLQVSWKVDKREMQFLKTKDIASKKYVYEKKTKTFFDAPFAEWVDNYSLWYDWHNTNRESKQYWFKRLVLTAEEIKRKYPMANPGRLRKALASPGGDLTDYASIRQSTRITNLYSTKSSVASALSSSSSYTFGSEKYYDTQDEANKMYEVYEWWRPFVDSYSVIVGGSHIPIFDKGEIPIPFDFKESPFIEVTYLKIPGEYEGYGLPLILESPQIMLNLIKNQRLDAATLSIHKMWIVNPLSNINKDELVTRPFGIIYSVDPEGVREVQFSDVKASAYKEEELLKGDMQYASGVDDFSQGVGGGAGSATEVRHLRESTLERVRMFVNHLGDAYADVLRYWMDLSRQLMSEDMTIRIVGKDGSPEYPLIEKTDLLGIYDYKAKVLPAIAGQDEVKKKQDMDLYQLLINLPFVDPQKLTAKVITDWGWSLDSVTKAEQNQAVPGAVGPDGQPMPPEGPATAPQSIDQLPQAPVAPMGAGGPGFDGAGGPGFQGFIPRSTLSRTVKHLRRTGESYGSEGSGFSQFSSPINLLKTGGAPPTVKGVPADDKSKKSIIPNIAGHNRKPGSRVDTNLPSAKTTSIESSLLNKSLSTQKAK